MKMSVRIVLVRVSMDVIAVTVRMRMAGSHGCGVAIAGKGIGDPLQHPGEIQNAKKNQHQPHGKFHREADTRGNHPAEKYDSASYHENRKRMTNTPERTDHR